MLLLPLKKLFRWHRREIKYDLLSRLAPDDNSRLVDVLQRLALDQRQNYKRNRHNIDLFFQYAQAANFAANQDRLERVLELGTGYSSMLLHRVRRDGTSIYSLDGRPIDDYDIAPVLLSLQGDVEFINGFSVTSLQMKEFYTGQSRGIFLDIPADRLRQALQDFIQPVESKYSKALGLAVGVDDFSRRCLDLLFDADGVRCLSSLFPGICLEESRFSQSTGDSALQALLKEAPEFDFIFFDCGEFSSMVEWTILKDRIRPGGLAVFHDIYFPKSVKNFLVAAAVTVDKEWEILYRDRTTPQGLLIARKRSA